MTPGWRCTVSSSSFSTNSRPRIAPACARFRIGVLEGELSHDASVAVLARHVGRRVARDTPTATVVTKAHPDSPRKIDAAVAAIVAYDRAMWHRAAGERLVRVPPKLMAPERRHGRARGRSDPIDALAVARAAIREPTLARPRTDEEPYRELKLLVDPSRRDRR